MPGSSSRASRSSSHSPPAVTVVSKPSSSWVAPIDDLAVGRAARGRPTSRVRGRGRSAAGTGRGARSRTTCPLTGRTGGSSSGGTPSRPCRSTDPAAITTWPASTRRAVLQAHAGGAAVLGQHLGRRARVRACRRARSTAASRAAVSRRGSIEPSSGASSPPRTEGASIGSRRRHSRPVSASAAIPSDSWNRRSSSRHREVVAVEGDLEDAVVAEARVPPGRSPPAPPRTTGSGRERRGRGAAAPPRRR